MTNNPILIRLSTLLDVEIPERAELGLAEADAVAVAWICDAIAAALELRNHELKTVVEARCER